MYAIRSYYVRDIAGLAGHTVAVPMRYSGHNLGMLRAMDELT